MYIKCEFDAGESVEHCATQSIELAKRIECGVRFQFNIVDCYAHPKGNAEEFAEKILAAASSHSHPKMAFSK